MVTLKFSTISNKQLAIPHILLCALVFFQNSPCWTQETGEDNFNTYCVVCHTIGGGRVIGPDLDGVHQRHSNDWLLEFIQSSQSLINSGDPEAVKIYKEYNGLIMPDSLLSENQIESVMDYIAAHNSAVPENSNPILEINENKNPAPTPEQISLGQNLFQGTERFSEDGAACNSCHDVKNDAVIGGGILAKDLTTVFSRMGKAGVEAVLGQAPYPVMQAAYENYPLTEQEIAALIAFLQDADSKGVLKQPRDYGLGLLASGVVGGLIIFALCGLLWRDRGKGSVNQAIYDRQVKSK